MKMELEWRMLCEVHEITRGVWSNVRIRRRSEADAKLLVMGL